MGRAGLTTLEEIDRVLGESALATVPVPDGGAEVPLTILLADDDRRVRALAPQLLENPMALGRRLRTDGHDLSWPWRAKHLRRIARRPIPPVWPPRLPRKPTTCRSVIPLSRMGFRGLRVELRPLPGLAPLRVKSRRPSPVARGIAGQVPRPD